MVYESATSREIRLARTAIKNYIEDRITTYHNDYMKPWVDKRISTYHNNVMKPWVLSNVWNFLKSKLFGVSKIDKV